MKYFLSNHQAKALKLEGKQLRIALPLPISFPDAPTQEQLRDFFLRHQVDVKPEWLRIVEETDLCINPMSGSFDELKFPKIVEPHEFHITTPAVIGWVCEEPTPRNGTLDIQWPGDLHKAAPPLDVAIDLQTERGTWTARLDKRQLVIRNPAGDIVATSTTGRDKIITHWMTALDGWHSTK